MYRWLHDSASNPAPSEYILLTNIERYGSRSILGRDVLSNLEIISFNYCKSLITAYFDPDRAQNMVDWSKRNKAAYNLYTEAKFLAAADYE